MNNNSQFNRPMAIKRDSWNRKVLSRDFAGSSLELLENPSYNQWKARCEDCIDRLIGEISIIRSELQNLYDRYQEERMIWRRSRRDLEDRVEALTASIEAEEQALAEASRQYRARFAELTLENRTLKGELQTGGGKPASQPPPTIVTVAEPPKPPPSPHKAETEESGGAFDGFIKSIKKIGEGPSRPPSPTGSHVPERTSEIETLKTKLKEMETKLTQKTKEHEETKVTLTKIQKEADNTKSKTDSQSKESGAMKQTLDVTKEELKKAKAEIELGQKETKRLTKELEDKKAETVKLKEGLDAKTEEVTKLKEELKNTMQALKSESEKTLTEKTQAYETRIKELDLEVNKHRIRQKDTDKKLTNLRHKVKEKKHTDATLATDLDELIEIQASNPEVNFFSKLFT